MLDSVEAILRYSRGITAGRFGSDEVLRDAILMRLVAIGEAAANLPEAFIERTPRIPWRSVIGMRNVIAHAYSSVNLAVVWTTVKDHLPDLRKKLRDLLSSC
ncbi:MAG: DUF86 domain-containing protein [Tepidisphaeraceae bacterium]